MKELLDCLKLVKEHYEADEIKVYYFNENDFSIKIIKNGVILKRIRKGDRKHKPITKESV